MLPPLAQWPNLALAWYRPPLFLARLLLGVRVVVTLVFLSLAPKLRRTTAPKLESVPAPRSGCNSESVCALRAAERRSNSPGLAVKKTERDEWRLVCE